jgi:hypothetical protein
LPRAPFAIGDSVAVLQVPVVLCRSTLRRCELISSQKDLDLPAHKVMVASVRCNQISEEHAAALQSDQAWMALHSESKAGKVVMDFKTRATDLISSCVWYASVPSAASS